MELFRLLARSVDIFEVYLLAYALMPNHLHFLVRTPKGNLSEVMRHFNISYTQLEIGKILGGIDYSAVSLGRKRLYLKIRKEPEWEKKINQIRNN
jgi:hypothetical protein